MSEFLIRYEPWIRMAAFGGVFALMALWEILWPRRARVLPRSQRWPGNLGLVVLNTLLLRLVLPGTAVGLAAAIELRGTGVLPLLGAPPWLAFAASLILLDLAIYLQHVLFHAIPALWRLHRVHHADIDVDASNGLRFHPIEILLSMGIKFAVIALLGPPAVAVMVFEVLLNASSIFNHGNARIALRLDHALRWFVVTPDMHRIHHSWYSVEHNSNYGFNLSWWDRLLGTYRAQPRDGHETMTLGLPILRGPESRRLGQLLLLPFVAVRQGGAPASAQDTERH